MLKQWRVCVDVSLEASHLAAIDISESRAVKEVVNGQSSPPLARETLTLLPSNGFPVKNMVNKWCSMMRDIHRPWQKR